MSGTILTLARRLQNKEQSAVELTKEYLDAVSRENGALNAYVHLTPDAALAAASAVDKARLRGEDLSPLAGIPMTLKDNLSTDGILTTCCSKILSGYTPVFDATTWALLKARGAVLLGKTNMDEFAMGSSCETSCYGGAKNPHNLERVAGGSSGGVASAVAGGIAAYGLGSDTGGSIRQPAAFCGLTGLKPTYGAVSRYGLIAYASSFDQVGPIAQTAEDAALVFDAISEKDPLDSTSQGRREETFPLLSQPVKGLKVALVKEYFDGLAGSTTESAIQAAAETLRAMGCEVCELSIPEISYSLPVYYILACAEASSNLGRYDGIRYGYRTEEGWESIHEMICKTRSEGFGAEVKRRILLGTYVLSAGYYDAYYKKAQSLRGAIHEAFEKAFCQADVLLCPTVPRTAFPLNFTGVDPVETYLTDICTVSVNIVGLPGLSVPCGSDEEGLPIGMQLIGRSFDEATLLRLAHQYETARGPYKSAERGVRV